jgi:hypothetical protein
MCKPLWYLILSALYVILVPNGWAESRVVPHPEVIVRSLKQAAPARITKLVQLLNLAAPEGRDDLCLEYDSIDLKYLRLANSREHAALKIVSQSCEREFVVVLQKQPGDRWQHVQTIALNAKYSVPEVSFPTLLDATEHQIVVRNHVVDYGTGILQNNVTIFKLIEARLEVIFDEIEKLIFEIPIRHNGKPTNTEQYQESEFTFIEADPGQGVAKRILEKQTIRDHQTTITRWRLFSWVPHLRKFRAFATSR